MNCEGKYQGGTTYKDGFGRCYKIEYNICNEPIGKVFVPDIDTAIIVDTTKYGIKIPAVSRSQEDNRTFSRKQTIGTYFIISYDNNGKVIDFNISTTPDVTVGIDKDITREVSIQNSLNGIKTYYTL